VTFLLWRWRRTPTSLSSLGDLSWLTDVKNGKLSLQVGDEKTAFSLPQSMASPTLDDDTCCRVNMLERALSQEAMTCHSVEDPLEAALIGFHMTGSHSGKKEEYDRLLNISTGHTPRHSPGEVLNIEELASKEKEKSPPKVELKPLPSYLRHEFLDPDHKFSVIISAKLGGSN